MTDPGEMLRRVLLAVTIAEFCDGDPLDVHSPTCPLCNEGPAFVLPAWQAFCGNDDCPTFMWNPRDTPEQFRRQATPVRVQTRRPDGSWVDEDQDDDEAPRG